MLLHVFLYVHTKPKWCDLNKTNLIIMQLWRLVYGIYKSLFVLYKSELSKS